MQNNNFLAKFQTYLKNNRLVRIYLLFILFSVLGAFLILLFIEKGDVVLQLNRLQTNFWNIFFIRATYFGEFWPTILLFFALLNKPRYELLAFALTIIVFLLALNIFKFHVFNEFERPMAVLKEFRLKAVPGVHPHKDHSFPSGHTTAAFAYSFYWFIALRRIPFISFIGLLLAYLVAVSRIYLVQHFFIDVVAGCVLGTFLATFVYFIVALNLKDHSFWKKKILN